ncbi:GLPGLI family protein [Prevotella dentasini]|uniref:GLPGLI family protein n=1 Tax=Prevotella dentasini TaxID=589537 RepID=UPI0004698F49|nr:GLPGLI family protein [Prevotella dentasini]
MKRKLLIFALTLLALTVQTQGVEAQNARKAKHAKPEVVIDKVNYRITYSVKSVKDENYRDSAGNYRYEDDVMRLDIGNKVSRFYSYLIQQNDSVIAAKLDKGNYFPIPSMKYGSMAWVLYKNYPEGKTVVFESMFRDVYRMEETTRQPGWNIVADSSATIMGYSCQMARANFKGRTWTAWYTEDIPLDFGPWKLCGLPGLILRAYDDSRQYIFEGVGLQQLDGSADITYRKEYDKAETISAQEFTELKRKTSPIDQLTAAGIKISFDDVAIPTDDGGTERMEDAFRRRQPYNPIER